MTNRNAAAATTVSSLSEINRLTAMVPGLVRQQPAAQEHSTEEAGDRHANLPVDFLIAEPIFAEDNLTQVIFTMKDRSSLPKIHNNVHLARAQAHALNEALPEYNFAVREASQAITARFPIIVSTAKRVTCFDPMMLIAYPVFNLLRDEQLVLPVIKFENYHIRRRENTAQNPRRGGHKNVAQAEPQEFDGSDVQ
jgi:hypothetical protein